MATFERDGIVFHYVDVGQGVPFVFQHGIGGDVGQPVGLVRPPNTLRLLCLDARAHGQTRPLGDPSALTFDVFGDDLVAWLDHLGVARAIIGGISMGAGVALNVAVRHPERVAGLVLSRPAARWRTCAPPPRSGCPPWCWPTGKTPSTASRSARCWRARSPGRGSSN